MSRKDFTFRFHGAVTLSLDPKEYQGCSVGEIERMLRQELRSAGIGRPPEYESVDITLAALELHGG